MLFKKAMEEIGLEVPKSAYVHSVEEALAAVKDIGFPAILRPSFTLGGHGGGIAYNLDEFVKLVAAGIEKSPVHGNPDRRIADRLERIRTGSDARSER